MQTTKLLNSKYMTDEIIRHKNNEGKSAIDYLDSDSFLYRYLLNKERNNDLTNLKRATIRGTLQTIPEDAQSVIAEDLIPNVDQNYFNPSIVKGGRKNKTHKNKNRNKKNKLLLRKNKISRKQFIH